MRRTQRGTKARLGFSGGPHAPVNMADSMEEVHVVRQVVANLEVLRRDSHRLFGSKNGPTTGILHTIRHVYRSMWPTREERPRFGAALAHDCETGF